MHPGEYPAPTLHGSSNAPVDEVPRAVRRGRLKVSVLIVSDRLKVGADTRRATPCLSDQRGKWCGTARDDWTVRSAVDSCCGHTGRKQIFTTRMNEFTQMRFSVRSPLYGPPYAYIHMCRYAYVYIPIRLTCHHRAKAPHTPQSWRRPPPLLRH